MLQLFVFQSCRDARWFVNGRRIDGSPLFVVDYGVNIGVGGVGGDCGLVNSGDGELARSIANHHELVVNQNINENKDEILQIEINVWQ